MADKAQFLDAGEIVGTHGVRGEIKVLPWGDSPDFLCQFSRFYFDGVPIQCKAARVHKRLVLISLERVDTVEQAMRFKGKVLQINRADVTLPEGHHFLADIVGLDVLDAVTDAQIGIVTEVLTPPAHPVYVVRGGEKEHLIPAVPAFIAETNLEKGYLKVRLIEGM